MCISTILYANNFYQQFCLYFKPNSKFMDFIIQTIFVQFMRFDESFLKIFFKDNKLRIFTKQP